MRPTTSLFLLAALLASACSKGGDATGDSTQAASGRDSTFDAAAMLDPGTKGLVVVDGFPKRPTYWDFDRVAYGARVTHVFRVRNEERRDVTVLDLLPSCGCTQASVRYTDAKGEVVSGVRGGESVLTIPAGTTFEVVCELDTTTAIERMNVDKLAQVRMRTDAPRAPYITFELHVIVERTFRSVPAVIELGEIPQSAGKARRADVSTESMEDTSRVVSIASVEGPFVATIDPTELQGRAFWIVVAEAQKGLPLGPVRGKLVLSTLRPDGTTPGAPFELPVTGQVVPDVVAHPALFAFGAFERDGLKEVSIELDALVPGERIAFLGAEAKGTGADKLAFDRMPIEPGAAEALARDAANAPKWRITLKTTSDFPLGPFSGTLEIKTDHPNVPKIVVPYQGVAK